MTNPTAADYQRADTEFRKNAPYHNLSNKTVLIIGSALTFAASQTRYVTDEEREVVGQSLGRIKDLITAAEGKV